MKLPIDPSEPEGQNATLTSATSLDGTPELGKMYKIAARTGMAVRLNKNQFITVFNSHGTQVCDFWAFKEDNFHEYLSMSHIHTDIGSLMPKEGDRLVSNYRQSLLTITKDTSPGVHDTCIACCDKTRYEQLGCEEYHDNCADNLRMATLAIGKRIPLVPAPFNLWMSVPIDTEGKLDWAPPSSKLGDQITFRADTDIIVVMSACPQDITPVNGADCAPQALHFKVD